VRDCSEYYEIKIDVFAQCSVIEAQMAGLKQSQCCGSCPLASQPVGISWHSLAIETSGLSVELVNFKVVLFLLVAVYIGVISLCIIHAVILTMVRSLPVLDCPSL
jgi:hypothetical protein